MSASGNAFWKSASVASYVLIDSLNVLPNVHNKIAVSCFLLAFTTSSAGFAVLSSSPSSQEVKTALEANRLAASKRYLNLFIAFNF